MDLMKHIDQLHIEDPSAGTRRLSNYLERITGHVVSRKRIRRLLRIMGIEAIYPRKRTTIPGGPSGIHPYLLKDIEVTRTNQVWAADITYIPMKRGFMYLFAIIDWYSRKIISWELSNTLDIDFCVRSLTKALAEYGPPEVMNTDQGSHFTSDKWQACLKDKDVKISMDGKGRWLDNVVIERFWRTIKYEDIYLNVYSTPNDLECGVGKFVSRYNSKRPHDSLGGKTPDEVYQEEFEKIV